MPDNPLKDAGRDMAMSDPFMKIGTTIAKVGQMVQDPSVPIPVRDAFRYIQDNAPQGGRYIEQALQMVKQHLEGAGKALSGATPQSLIDMIRGK
jgi:hypothetical protein